MSDQVLHPGATEAGRAGHSRWWRGLALGLEFVVLFLAALWLTAWVLPGLKGVYPSPLWLPVIVLSLQYGLEAGVAAALIAVVCQFANGLPPMAMSEDLYAYLGRIGAEPVGWSLAALLIGHIRTRQIAQKSELDAELDERSRHCDTVSRLCEDLRRRTEMLERHIAANAQVSQIDIAEAIAGLHGATWENFGERLTCFVNLMLGSSEFALYLLRGEALRLVFQPQDADVLPADPRLEADDGVFSAVVREGRALLASRPADRALIAERGALFGPVKEAVSGRIIGMLSVGSADLTDFPEDIERRLALAAAEIARFLGRVILIEPPRSHEPDTPRAQPGERLAHAHTIAQRLTLQRKNRDPVA